MPRPRRQAALDAIDKIKRVQKWEAMSESSQSFRVAAAMIEAEFHAEEINRHVAKEDLDSDENCTTEDEQADENSTTMESFIEEDFVSNDTDYNPESDLEEEDNLEQECQSELEKDELEKKDEDNKLGDIRQLLSTAQEAVESPVEKECHVFMLHPHDVKASASGGGDGSVLGDLQMDGLDDDTEMDTST